MNLLINVIAFKIGWVSAVLGGANGMPLAGPAVIFVAVLIHLRLAAEPRRELALIVLTGVIGGAWDSIMVQAGWVSYATGMLFNGFAPYWILAMWMLFATTLNVAFRWLQDKLLLAAALGAVSGPLSYYAGNKIGAIVFNDFQMAMIGLAVAWSVLFPLLLVLARQFDGTIAAKVTQQATRSA